MALKTWCFIVMLFVSQLTTLTFAQNNLRQSMVAVDSLIMPDISQADPSTINRLIEQTKDLYKVSPTKAIVFLNQLEKELLKLDNQDFKIQIISLKGNFYWSVGIFNVALSNFFEALSYYESKGNEEEVVKMLNNIGETYKKQKNYVMAQDFLNTAVQKSNKIGGRKYLLIEVNMAQLYMLMDRDADALAILKPIIKDTSYSEETMNAIGYAYLYTGIMSKKQAPYDSTLFLLNRSLQIWEEKGLTRNISESLAEIAGLQISRGYFRQAKNTLAHAEANATNAEALDILMRIYQFQIDLIERNSSNDSLSYFYKKYVAIKDSIYNEASRKEINKLTIQYDLLEKEKDNYKLALGQEQLKNQNKNQQALLVVLLLIIVIAVASIYMQIKKRKQLASAHAALKAQKVEIESKQLQLSQKSLELANLNQELYNLNRTLEQKIINRSEQLNIKNKQIAEYTFYNSHKLRAPVASILGLINVMELNKEGKVDEGLIEHLKTCAVELDRVIHQLKVLLDTELLNELG